MKQEVACRVVSSKTNASAKGYVEVEFFQPAPGFWGITFPAGSSAPQVEPAPIASAPKQSRVEPAAAKPAFFQPKIATPQAAVPVAPVIERPAPAPVSVAPAPVMPAPVAQVPTPDATQELNRAIAAAWAAPVESVKKPEPIQEPPVVQDAVLASAPVSPVSVVPSISEPISPAPVKTLNPAKPKSSIAAGQSIQRKILFLQFATGYGRFN